jgi:MFS family permease
MMPRAGDARTRLVTQAEDHSLVRGPFSGQAAGCLCFGRVAGLAVFSIGSTAGGRAQSVARLIGARAVQRLGAAMLTPAALSLVTSPFEEDPNGTKPRRWSRRLDDGVSCRQWR